jgi:murein DD-endopeptidase MepM/ murein hydrolase activator NlpD
MNLQRELYTVRKNDTLWKIARNHGTTVDELQKINGIKNPRAIHEGQQIALDKEAVGGFRVLFLDLDRNAIPNLNYRLQTNGKTYTGKSTASGETKRIVTDSPFDLVFIWVQRIDKTWKKLRTVMSGFGDKQAVMVSGHMAIPAKTEKHPDLPPGSKPDSRARPQPKHAPTKPPAPTTDKKDLGPKATPTKTPDGKPLTSVDGDIAALDFLGGYTGEKIEDKDYEDAANKLGCEVEVIKAIAKQETGKLEALGLGAFDKQNRPTILYERHIFSKMTDRAYDSKYPDLSSEKEYLAGTAKDKEGKKYDDGEHYGLFSWQYKKLAKATLLNKEAAIQACSWGKFQVLGSNYKLCGFSSAVAFAKAMCKSEKEHLNVMVSFCIGNKLEPALKSKNWKAIAMTYNGPKYKKNKYDTELEAHYNAFKKAAKK